MIERERMKDKDILDLVLIDHHHHHQLDTLDLHNLDCLNGLFFDDHFFVNCEWH